MSNTWQMQASFAWSMMDGDIALDYTDPNNQLDFVHVGATAPQGSMASPVQPHAFKLLGSYQALSGLPFDRNLSVASRRVRRQWSASSAARLVSPQHCADQGAGTIAWPASVAVAALALKLFLPGWDRELLASGAYKYAPYLGSDNFEAVLRAGTLDYYKEGAAATVSVRRLTGTTALAIDGKMDASNAGDMLTQRMLGLLPVLVHGQAHDICIIGLGSGVTLGSALASGTIQHADVVEISPEVVEATRFFDRENGGALAQPGVRLIVGDRRSHFLLTPGLYDVIVSEPSNSWMALGQRDCARSAFEAAIQAPPRDASGYVNAGVFSLQTANPAAAVDYFAGALTIDPGTKLARDGLA